MDKSITEAVRAVQDAVNYEIDINLDCSDAHTAADIASDVVHSLIREFELWDIVPESFYDPVEDRGQVLPGQKLDGGTVVASVVLNDDDPRAVSWMALLLMPTPGHHYRVVEVLHLQASRVVQSRVDFPNIVPAVEAYVQNGGDY